jgi:hypothetical protein
MEQEDAQAKLANGLKLEQGDLGGLITEFKQLVPHARYDINQELVLHIFTRALPNTMYKHILQSLRPVTYKQWQHATIKQQKIYTHMKNRAEQFKNRMQPPSAINQPWKYTNPHCNPNAMDTSPGQTRARIAEAEDFLPGGTQYEQQVGGSREGGLPQGQNQESPHVTSCRDMDTQHAFSVTVVMTCTFLFSWTTCQ